MEGYFGTVAYQLECAAKYLPRSPNKIAPGIKGVIIAAVLCFLKPAFRFTAALFRVVDETQRFTECGMPKNYVALAVKAEGSSA
jgi:hypothetical protein